MNIEVVILPGLNFPNMSVRKELETSLTISSANFIAFVPYQIFKRIHLAIFSNFTVQLLLLSTAHVSNNKNHQKSISSKTMSR